MTFKDLAGLLPSLGLWIALSGVIFSAVSAVGAKATPQAKAFFGKLLTHPGTHHLYRHTLRAFLRFFDQTFKARRVGAWIYLVSLTRSAVSTLLCLLGVSAYLWLFTDFHWNYILYDWHIPFAEQTPSLFAFGSGAPIVVFIYSFFLNFLIDYLSICQTRSFLQFRFRGGLRRKILLLLADVVATTVLVIVAAVVCILLYDGLTADEPSLGNDGPLTSLVFAMAYAVPAWENAICYVVQGSNCFGLFLSSQSLDALAGSGADGRIAFGYVPGFSDASVPFILTTYLTSVWLWIYALAVMLFRVAVRIDPLRRFLDFMFDAKQQPFFVMGLFAAMLWTLFYWAILHDYGGPGL